jgi:hypothetical protein
LIADCGLATADFQMSDLRLRLSIVDLPLNQQSAVSIGNPQSENRQSPFRNPQ